ncbi:hypothetical protein GCM10020227_03880 [Streptomyces flavovirens]
MVGECLPVAAGEVRPVEVPQVQDGSAEGAALPVQVGEEALQIGRGPGVDGVRAAGPRRRVPVAPAHQTAAFAPGLGEGGEGVGDPVAVGEEQPAVVPRRGGRAVGLGRLGRALGPDGLGEPGVDGGACDGGRRLLHVGGPESADPAQRRSVVGVQGDVPEGGVLVTGEHRGVYPKRLVADGSERHLAHRERQPDAGARRGAVLQDLWGQQRLEAGVEQDRVEVVAGRVVTDGLGWADPGEHLPGADPDLFDGLEGGPVVVAEPGERGVAGGSVEASVGACQDRRGVERGAGVAALSAADHAARVHGPLSVGSGRGGDGEGGVLQGERELNGPVLGVGEEECLAQVDVGEDGVGASGEPQDGLGGHLQIAGGGEHHGVLDAVVGQVRQALRVQPGLPGRLRVVGAAAEERVVEEAQTYLGDRRRLGPVAVALPGVAGQGDRPSGGLEGVPVDAGADVVEGGERGGEPFALVLLAADRGQGEAGGPPGVEAFADRVAEHRVRADLQEHLVPVVGQAVHGRPEAHPVTHVLPPVGRVEFGAVRGSLLAGEVQRDPGPARGERGQRLEQLVLDPFHADAVVGDFDGEELGEELIGLQLLGQQAQRLLIAREREGGGAVDRGDRDPVPVGAHPALGLVLRQAHGEHGARAGQGLLEPAAVHHDPDRVLEGVDARLVEGGDLPGAVSHHGVRPHPVRPPHGGQADLQGEVGGLREPGLTHARGGFAGGHLRQQGPVGELPQDAVALGHGFPERRLVTEEFAAHAPPLGPHAGEDPDQPAFVGGTQAALDDPGVGLAPPVRGERLFQGGA